MAFLDLVTLATVRELRGWSVDATQDGILSDMISGVSARFEGELGGRLLSLEARTIQLDVEPNQRELSLPAWPVAASPAAQFRTSADRDFSGAVIATSDYYLQESQGRVSFDVGLDRGRGTLQVIFTGGIAATAADVETNYPDISDAIRKQVVYEFERKDNLGQSSNTVGQVSRAWTGVVDWLPEVVGVINHYRRLVFA